MSEERKAIRKKITSLLKSKKVADGNVVSARSIGEWTENLPAVSVYPQGEESEEYTQSERELKRTMRLLVEVKAKGRGNDPQEDAADECDDICDEIENIIGSAEAKDGLDCLADDIILDASELEYDSEGQDSVATARLLFEVKYLKRVPKDQGGQGLTDLKGADVDWDIGTAKDPDAEAEDTLDTELA